MRAAVVTAPRHIEIVDAPLPEPAAGQVRIKLEGCGLCASNVPVYEGRPWFNYPLKPGQLGHEGWGVIDALGPEVTEFHVGDRVAALSQNAYAEYDVASTDAVVRLPHALDKQPFPAEPLGCAINVLRRSGIRAGDTVAIVGIGFLGALLTRLAQQAGARVIAINRRPGPLQIARHMGAMHTLHGEDRQSLVEQVKQLTNNHLCDVVIEAVGVQSSLDIASDLVRERGRLIIAGYHQDGLRTVNLQQWNWRGLDVINAHEREPSIYLQGMRDAIDEVAHGRLTFTPLITHVFALEDLGQAMESLVARPEGFMKAIVTM